MKYEVMRYISICLMWVATAMNLLAFFLGMRTHKRATKLIDKANAIIFKSIRENGKHVTLAEGGKLCNHCQHSGEGCSVAAGVDCTRFLPTEGTNLTSIKGVVETPPEVDPDEFTDLFVDWIESKGWLCAATFKPYVEEAKNEGND